MFDDLISEFVPIHRDIFKAAVEWAEYVLYMRVRARSTVDVGGLKNEMKELLSQRLGKSWWKQYDAFLEYEITGRKIIISYKELK